MCIICKSTLEYFNQLTTLDCLGCKSLTSIPQLNQLTTLYCGGCTSLTSIPQLNQLTRLGCSGCTLLTCIPNNQYSYINTRGCKWLDENNHKSLPVLQRF